MDYSDLNDVEDIVDEGDVYCTITLHKNAVRVRSLNYTCLGCAIRIEKKAGRSGGCCGDSINYYTTNIQNFHNHLNLHKSRGEVVPDIYYELKIDKK